MPPISEHFDDHARAREVKVDTNKTITTSGQHHLRRWPGKTGVRAEAEEFAFEPAVATPSQLCALDCLDESRNAVHALAP